MTEYSHSRISTFETCARQFKYRYVDKITVETEGIEAFVGRRVHEILERLYHHVARHSRPPSLAQVLDRFRKDWSHNYHDQILIVRKENPAGYYLGRGERCLENYYRSHYPFDDGETVAIEERIRLRLDREGRYRCVGAVPTRDTASNTTLKQTARLPSGPDYRTRGGACLGLRDHWWTC